MTEPAWEPVVHRVPPRSIPNEVRARLMEPSAVEDLADSLRRAGCNLAANYAHAEPTTESGQWLGPVVTARYVTRRLIGSESRLGHGHIAKVMTPGSIVVMEAHQEGSVLGGKAAATLRGAGAAACFIDGCGRDLAEILETGLGVAAKEWGIRSGREISELQEVGGVIRFQNITIHPGDVVLANRFGLVAIPSWLSWDEVLEYAKG